LISAGELTALPDPSWNKGNLLLRERERCREGKVRRRRKGRRRRGEGKEVDPRVY